jgi:hypothetical protein
MLVNREERTEMKKVPLSKKNEEVTIADNVWHICKAIICSTVGLLQTDAGTIMCQWNEIILKRTH